MSLPASRRLDFSEVPIIDIGPLVAGGEARNTVEEMGRACSQVGFFYASNHGVPATLIESLHTEAARFFALPHEKKLRTMLDPAMRGYLPLNYRSHEDEERGGTNLQEGFWMGPERPPDPAHPYDGPNQWPADSVGLKPAMEAYFVALEALAGHLKRGFSMTLDVDLVRLRCHFERDQSRLKLNHYPPQDAPQSLDEIGVLPHSDTGAFTILWQDHNGGLEIENKNEEWVGVPPIPDTFVINLGNVMQMWSFGRFSSTPHRVINRSGGDRYSVPFFVNPGHQAMIEPLVATHDADFEPFEFGAYQREAFAGIYPVVFGGLRSK